MPRGLLQPARAPVALLWLVAILFVTTYVTTVRPVSLIDEAPHLDYVLRMPSDFPSAGKPLLEETQDVWACRRMEREAGLPACGSEYSYTDFPNGGYGLAGAHPPGYYLVTAAVGGLLRAVSPLDTLDSYRMVGVLWLGAALTVSYLVALRLGAPRATAASLVVVAAASSSAVARASTLGPDTASWFAGGLVVLAAVSHAGRRRDTLLLLLTCLVAALIKQTSFMAVGAAMVFLVLRRPIASARTDSSADSRAFSPADWSLALGAFLAFVVPSLTWTALNSFFAVQDFSALPQNQQFVVDSLPVSAVLSQAFSFITPLGDAPLGGFMNNQPQWAANAVAQAVLVLGLLGALLGAEREDASRRTPTAAQALAIGVLVLLLVSGPLLAAANYATTSSFFDLRPRYGFPLLPALLACAGVAFTGRVWGRVFLALAVGAVALVLAQSAWVGIFPAPVAA